ncbi:helix-turn-helix transcriptional regulator [Dongshaea marina]|uniref:helix-turn-helix transcriptional regulator n=1 Tax=Dongshaea marina TaxID=2047966 RepID=UPI000D3E3AA4|nr:LuxR family transcriptional regulator [Dongshaea marina]
MYSQPAAQSIQPARIRHAEMVKELTGSLLDIEGVVACVVMIILRGGERSWLSCSKSNSNNQVSCDFFKNGLYRADILTQGAFLGKNRVIFPEEYVHLDELEKSYFQHLLSYGLHRCYSLARSCSDCHILVHCYSDESPTNPFQFYERTVSPLEQFTAQFIDRTMELYCEELPQLSYSRFSQDEKYRQHVLTRRSDLPETQFSRSELQVLYWSAQGKTAEEIAFVLDISHHTVKTYRHRLIKKLNATNMTHAVYLGKQLSLIP